MGGWLRGELLPFPLLTTGMVEGVGGWLMAFGRGDLEDERVKAEYERGYKVLLDFYHQHL